MFDFFYKIIGFFETLFIYLENLWDSLCSAVSLILTSLALPPYLVMSVPGILGGSILITATIYIVRILIGFG